LHELGGVGVGGIDQHLNLGVHAASEILAEVERDDQRAARGIGAEGFRRLLVGGPGNDVEGVGSAEGVYEIARGRGVIEILNDDRLAGDGERNG
jgi:hypothetical protein